MVFKSISLHYLAIFRQILMPVLPSYLFRNHAFDFLLGEWTALGGMCYLCNTTFPMGMLWSRLGPVCEASPVLLD